MAWGSNSLFQEVQQTSPNAAPGTELKGVYVKEGASCRHSLEKQRSLAQ